MPTPTGQACCVQFFVKLATTDLTYNVPGSDFHSLTIWDRKAGIRTFRLAYINTDN